MRHNRIKYYQKLKGMSGAMITTSTKDVCLDKYIQEI
jgi:hypothetical protein